MRNRKSTLIAAVIMFFAIITISVLSIKAAANNSGMTYMAIFGKAELRNTVEIPLSQVEQLEVIYGSKNLKVYPIKGDTIIIKEYLFSDKKEAQAKVAYGTLEDGRQTVTVEGSKNINIVIFGMVTEGERIEIYIPEEGLEALMLQTGSGNITAEENFAIQVTKLSVTAGSGNIKWHDTESEELHVQTSSGNITLEHLSGEMTVQAGSGNIRINEATGSAALKVSSGNITVEQFSGGGTFETGSGNIHMESMDVTENMDLQTGSGNVRLALPEELSFQIEVNTGSGNITTFFDEEISYNKKGNQASGTVGKNPVCLIQIKTGSGNVRITEG